LSHYLTFLYYDSLFGCRFDLHLQYNFVTRSSTPSIFELLFQETQILLRVAELKRNGLWSASRLPLCVEPPRNKTHWDYVLEEVKWMATDFRMERQFKRTVARKIAAAIQKKRKDDELEQERAQQRAIRDGKRVCASIAKMVREFWMTVDKVVEHRAQEILEAKKRKALDAHMAFIVGEADKLSSIVQEGLTQDRASKTPSVYSRDEENDDDFSASESESDDEVTIEREEAAMQEGDIEDVKEEVSALSKDADQDMDDFLASVSPITTAKKSTRSENDDEIEEVAAKRQKLDEASDEDNNSVYSLSLQSFCSSQEGNGDGRGMLESVDYSKLNSVNSDERQQELANIAEAALKFQPKGYTLETTQVKTAVPFLIRGTLREYQMVGLDWLVTLYEKNLNGILADEMGLGKTIQTIALLAHLACCESIWGPHLIIVPTSVILNWEMELKKWCPAFKILTYFGTQKDRAEKRRGWSKPNAFHVCITSYKTVTTDIRAFKMKAWQYLILDEAQNIKNFKSQRWQALLNVKARRRLLLTGTPLQNSLMELWSLMHFLMPAIFASHDDFKDWFSNPLTGMMDGSVEFNAPLVQQLHKQMSLFRTRENLKSGNVLSVLNIVMQLRKCCNHPNLFEQRSVESPMCLHHLRLNVPGLLVDLDEKVFGRDLPEIFDLRKRFTGVARSNSIWSSSQNFVNCCTREFLYVSENSILKAPGYFLQHLLRCTTAVSKVAPLTVSTATSGFHYVMQNGGVHELDLSASLSPPLKRQPVTGEFADLIPVEVVQRMEENNRLRLQRIVERFECQQLPFYSSQLISFSVFFDVRESLYEWVADVMERFWIWVNPAVTNPPELQTSSSGHGYRVRLADRRINEKSRSLLTLVHPLAHKAIIASQLHFPELRLIEYDCGKLQALARLLRRLYALKHRCLIFTQMSRMLDVLQAFLSYHGYQYFRLDGTTGIEQRQASAASYAMMGGYGHFLRFGLESYYGRTGTGQICHRVNDFIGQTRNVTIFRLISERTIEENILRKANQKRRLGEMAIDDAGFTPEFFKQSDNIRSVMFNASGFVVVVIKSSQMVAMATLEDEQDVTAARLVLAETKADIAEFDETRNVVAPEGSLGDPLDEKYIELISQLKPIERYAVNFLEAEYKPEFEEEVREAEVYFEAFNRRLFERFTWTPFPTPPLSDTDNDIYFDECLDLLYDRDFMTEEQLPQEIHELPCSLNKPCSPVKQPGILSQSTLLLDAVTDSRASKKERRALPRQLEQKGRELMRPVTPPPAVREEYDYEGPEWNIIEDQALLTAVRNEELMCHSFERVKTSLRFNWEYISGFVNRVTRFYSMTVDLTCELSITYALHVFSLSVIT
uniref:Helicase domino n=1 Tax=Haemonchus placei TaxID=6290 RepID=A0A0N4WCL1_HAEPC